MGLTRSQLITLVTLTAGTFLAVFNQTFLSPVLPTFMAEFEVEATVVQWLTSGYSLTMAIIIPLSPFLLGRFGSRKLFIFSMGLFLAGSIIAAASPAFWLLLFGRVLQAAAVGILIPMSTTIILLEVPVSARGRAMGIVMLVSGFAPAIGPTLSGALVGLVGWRVLFVAVSALALAILISAVASLKNNDFDPTTFDAPSVIMSSVGLICLLYGLSSFARSGDATLSIVLSAAGLILVGGFVVRQLRLEVPLLDVSVLKVGRYRASAIVLMLDVGINTGMIVLLPLYVQNLLGCTALQTGLAMLPGALIGGVVGLVAGKLFDARGIRICAVPGTIMLFASMLVAAIWCDQHASLILVAVMYAFMFAGIQLLNTTVGTWGLNALDNKLIQHAQATGNTLNQVTGSLLTAVVISITAFVTTLAPAGAAQVAALESGYHAGFVAVCVVAFLNLITVLLFVRDKRGEGSGAKDGLTQAESEAEAVQLMED